MSSSRIAIFFATLHRTRDALFGMPRRSRDALFGMPRRSRKRPSMTTRQWLILTFTVAALVGVIFVLTLYYSTGR